MKKLLTVIALTALVGSAACDKKDAAAGGETGEAGGTGAAVVTETIPDDLAKEAEKEITEDNAEQVAADLEKEIEADN